MYVSAPRLSTNGTLTQSDSLKGRVAANPLRTSIGEAAGEVDVSTTTSPSVRITTSTRSSMQSGITGFKSYRETPYSASYRRFRPIQPFKGVFRYTATASAAKYAAENLPIGIGYTGFNNTGVPDVTVQVDPSSGSLAPTEVYNRTVIAMAQRRCEVECKQKMLDTKLDMAETMVDIDKTVLLVAKRSMQVLRAWRHLRATNYRAAAKLLGQKAKARWTHDTPANVWLELQYAWLPLLSDIFGAVELTKSLLNKRRDVARVRRRVSDPLLLDQVALPSEWGKTKYDYEARVDVEVQLRFKINDSNFALLSGLNLTNPLYIAWVGMPLTFVVDWILPIGDWLNSLTAPLGLTFLKGYRTTKSYGKITVSGTRVTRQFWVLELPLQEAQSTAESMYMTRISYNSFPMSMTYFRFPFRSPQRIASAVALAQQTSKLR